LARCKLIAASYSWVGTHVVDTMSTTQSSPEQPGSMPNVLQDESETVESVAAETVLDTLSDGYAQQIVEVLASQPAPAAIIVEQLDASRPTVYRRLNSLEAAGIIESTVALDPDGHHRKRFHLTVENIGFQLDTDGISITLTE